MTTVIFRNFGAISPQSHSSTGRPEREAKAAFEAWKAAGLPDPETLPEEKVYRGYHSHTGCQTSIGIILEAHPKGLEHLGYHNKRLGIMFIDAMFLPDGWKLEI